MINLDTHILIYAILDELRSQEDSALADDDWSISSIVLWEWAMLSQRGRVTIHLESEGVPEILSQLRIWPIDTKIALASTRLDFRSDPADEIIAATSIVHNVPLLTCDRTLQQSQLIPLVAGI